MRCRFSKASTYKTSIFSIGLDVMPGSNTFSTLFRYNKVCVVNDDCKFISFFHIPIIISNNLKQAHLQKISKAL